MKKITIIDYGLGNLRSIKKSLEYAGATSSISSNPDVISSSDGLILPGVGAFISAMKSIESFYDILNEFVKSGKPIFGICLGQQILMSESFEGGHTKGLDFIPGKVIRFPDNELKVPQIGWNSLNITQNHPIFEEIPNNSYVYFVHSYFVDADISHTLATSDYGIDFAAAIVNDAGNVIGTQFHPEKSGAIGQRMIKNFIKMC